VPIRHPVLTLAPAEDRLYVWMTLACSALDGSNAIGTPLGWWTR